MTAVAPSPKTTLVILLGASRWPFSPEFQASKAFLNSMMEVREYFLNPSEFGLPHENLLNLFNSNQSSDDLDGEMGHFIGRRMTVMKQAGEVARDLLVYFIGHGGFVGNDSDFYLAIRRTRTDNPGASAIRMMSLAYTLKEKARYLRRIVILDCCFAGAAFLAFQSDPAQTAILQTVDAFKVQGKGMGVPERGTSLLCSSRHNTPSLISQDGSHTLFSQALVRALSTGNPRRPDRLSLRALAELTEDVLDTMPEQSVPRPEVHSPDQVDGDVADVPLFPNVAVKGVRSSHTLPSQTSQPMQIQLQPSHASQLANSSLSQQTQSSQSTSTYGKPRRLLFANNITRNVILFVLAILLIFGAASFALNLTRNAGSNPGSTPGTTSAPVPSLPNGIGVTEAPDGEYIGISDGTFAFDTNRPDGRFKTQAADKLKAGDIGGAESLWRAGLATDTNDAEALIYLEDQQVIASGNTYITLVVGTMITGDNVGVGRDDLQGAYVAQKEYNDGHKLPNNVEVRLLIANSGNVSAYATSVAQQIVQAAKQDHTIVGVMGWPYSSRTVDAVGTLANAHIPLVSQTASSDQLTGISSYFFRVASSNKGQAIAGAQYAERVLHARNVALFVDPADSYSSSLATDFSQQFVADGNHIVATENYTVGPQGQGKLPIRLQDALSHNPDLIYFSGYSTDISVLLTNLPTAGPYASLQILGGDALYEVGGYSSSARANFTRLHFTAFAYPDEWGNSGLGAQQPAFFNEYVAAYNPNGQQPGGKYGYTRTSSDVMLSYDATLALLTGSKIALSGGKTSITPTDMQQGLKQIMGAQVLQGVTGPIAFGSNGDPIGKPFVVLAVDALGRIHEERLQGCLLVGPCS